MNLESVSKPVRITAIVFKYLLGAIFVVFGLNKFLNFIPPFEYPADSAPAAFFGGLFKSGYFFYMLGLFEVVAGAFLLVGRFIPLGIAILGPITLNIFFFHMFLDPANGLLAVIVFLGNPFPGMGL